MGKQELKAKDIDGKDIYLVETVDGVNTVRFVGYFYCAGVSVDDNPAHTWRSAEISSDNITVDRLKDMLDNNGIDDYQSECKQWVEDLSEDDVCRRFSTYFSAVLNSGVGTMPEPLSLCDVTESTPCGCYYNK